ncbi:MAG: chorismate synthase [Cyanobacteria bacterium REEB67]|nr:chorismate synthase [Cyanobacteria bacterium REEB67]
MLRLLTAGESHGKALVSILDGFPAGLKVDLDRVNEELRLRQGGYGRSGRQKIETDQVEMLGGLRHGITSGAPLAYTIPNRDNQNWLYVMKVRPLDEAEVGSEESLAQHQSKKIDRFRPGHADYAGLIKYAQRDVRDVLERSSARETASRVAAGAFCREMLRALDVRVTSHVVQIGAAASTMDLSNLSLDEIEAKCRISEVFCADETASQAMKEEILQAQKDGDSLGGVVEVLIDNLPVGLGSYTQWDRRLDGLLAQALMSIQAMKAVEVGDGFKAAAMRGSAVHDAMYPADNGHKLPVKRLTNHAGGVEGGMTNGERLIVRAYMKPIPTIKQGLPSVGFPAFEADRAHYERSDVCAVSAASVVARAMVCLTVANLFTDKFAADSMGELSNSVRAYRDSCQSITKGRD